MAIEGYQMSDMLDKLAEAIQLILTTVSGIASGAAIVLILDRRKIRYDKRGHLR